MLCQSKNNSDERAVKNFCKYLQIPTVHPNVDYEPAVKFLGGLAQEMELPYKVVRISPEKPVLVITWEGEQPNLPSILLNSHMDVVPVDEDKWTYKPFAADIVDGTIYARGSQDMKCVGIQHLESVIRLKKRGISLQRTIHITFVPDEEIGGDQGMQEFVKTQEFKNLNVGFAFDESMASKTDEYVIFNGERCCWEISLHCCGSAAHGALMARDTAGDKATYILNKIQEFRNKQFKKLKDNRDCKVTDVTSMNVTRISGGVQSNVVPSEFIIQLDCRLPVTVDFDEWESMFEQWCQGAGGEVWVEYTRKSEKIQTTQLDDSNLYWVAIKEAFQELGVKFKIRISGGGSDARYIRKEGVPTIGFSPIVNSEILLHNHNEYLEIETFLKGIEVFCKILTKVGNAEFRRLIGT